MATNKHKNYETLNLIGYALSKFNLNFVKEFGFETKNKFYEEIVKFNIADTTGTVKNRQDLFDPFFDNERRGWWQKGDAYIHRKILIDSLYGELNVKEFSNLVKIYIKETFKVDIKNVENISPILKSKFRQLQETGKEAELFFINNFKNFHKFREGSIEDARLFGDGYDFQIKVLDRFFLVEIKGLHINYGSVRFTKNEFLKAQKFKNDYGLVIVRNLSNIPRMTLIFDPVNKLNFKKQITTNKQITYHTESNNWR